LGRFSSGPRMSKLHSLGHTTTLKQRMRQLRRLRSQQSCMTLDGGGLSGEQKEQILMTFQRYDEDGSGTLDAAELREALADLGYFPRSREEKRQLAQILLRRDTQTEGELTVAEFQGVVVDVMRTCRQALLIELGEQFQIHDEDGSGKLSKNEAYGILEDMDLAPRTTDERQLVDAAFALALGPGAEPSDDDEIDFAAYEAFTISVREGIGRHRRDRLHKITEDHELDRRIAQAFCHDLCEMKDRFDAVDSRGKGRLTPTEMSIFLSDCGIRSTSADQNEKAKMIVSAANDDSHGGIAFVDSLSAILCIRKNARDNMRSFLRELFDRTDVDRSGCLSLQECSQMLGRLGCNPHTRAQQRHIAYLLDIADEDGSEEYDFEEFSVLFQHVLEMTERLSRRGECEMAERLDLTKQQVEEYREAFRVVDEEFTGSLKIADVRRLVDALRVPVSGDVLHEIVEEVDSDGSGVIEFSEFLQLMSLVEQRRRASKGLGESAGHIDRSSVVAAGGA